MDILSFFSDFSNLVLPKTRKWQYLGYLSSKLKNEGTLFCQTLKVGENKVPLFFHFEAHLRRYRIFVFLKHFLKEKVKIRKS